MFQSATAPHVNRELCEVQRAAPIRPSRTARRKDQPPVIASATVDTSMPPPSFHEWLGNRPEEVPDATRLALVIARSGAAGISLDSLRRVVRLSPETLQDLLRALTAAGQVEVLKVNGKMVYRAAG
jgi:hypothetical protein